jgi:hypothetical protein
MKRAVGSAIVVSNTGQDAGAQLQHGSTIESGKQTADEDAEPDLNLVEPGTVLGRIDEANAVGRVSKKRGPRFHRGQMTAFALDTQILLEAALLGHQTHQGFRLMRTLVGKSMKTQLACGSVWMVWAR